MDVASVLLHEHSVSIDYIPKRQVFYFIWPKQGKDENSNLKNYLPHEFHTKETRNNNNCDESIFEWC